MYPLHGDLTRSSCQPPAWMATPYLPGRVKDLRLGPRASMRSLRRARDRSSPSECWATSPTAPCAPKTQPAGVDSYEPGLWGESASTFLPFYQRICVTVTRRLFPKTKWQGFLFTSLRSQCIVANASENVKFLSPLVSTFSTE